MATRRPAAPKLARHILVLAGDLLSSLWAVTGRRRALMLLLLTFGLMLEAGLLVLLVPTFNAVLGGGVQGGGLEGVLAIGQSGAELSRLALLLAAIAAIVMVRGAFSAARDVGLLRVQLGFADAERRRLLQTLAFAPWSRVARIDHALLTGAMTSEIQRLSSCAEAVLRGLVAFPSMILQLGFALALAPGFALMVIGLAVAGGVVALLGQRSLFELGRAVTEANRAIFAGIHGLLGSLKTAAAQDSQNDLIDELDAVQVTLVERQVVNRRSRLQRGQMVVMVLLAILSATVLLGLGVFKVPPARVALMLFLFARMTIPAMQIGGAVQRAILNLPALGSLRVLAAEIGDPAAPAPADSLPILSGSLTLAGVTFHHPEGPGIADVDMTIEHGALIAVAGESGHGKTTLLDVIAGLLTPQRGTIALGGTHLAGGALRQWRSQLAYVPQDGFLFPDTVRRNLTWGNRAVTESALHRAIETVGASELLGRIGGLDAKIGERGTRLSGGERQRLVIARALVREPRWLILDEASNALDVAAEAALLDRLAALPNRPTIIMSSHRSDIIARCDRVVRVNRGRIAVAQ